MFDHARNMSSSLAPKLEFYFEGRVVGYFEGNAPPRAAGRYGYMPYRTPKAKRCVECGVA
jgi:hypothetical protein